MTLEFTDEFRTGLIRLEEGHNLFLTGKAGTGKSTLIRHFIENTNRRVVVAAPTGIAALNVGGHTLHRLFGFGQHTDLETVRAGRYSPGRFKDAINEVETLVIDEASMVRADLFDLMSEALKRFGPKRGEPFGGVQIALVGDLYQLPPVVTDGEEEYFSTRYETPYFFSADSFSTENFPTVQLSKVYRQIGDTQLTDLLNSIRDGRMARDTISVLNRQTDSTFEPPTDEFWVTLATTNRIATARNNRALDRLDGEAHHSTALIEGDVAPSDYPTDRELTVKVGAQIMMLTNDPVDRWVNGTMAVITAIDPDGRSVTADTREGRTIVINPHTWDITKPAATGGQLRQKRIGTFTQWPFRLAWAITIHKSQGQTLDRAVIDLSGGTRATGQLYVALSRCTSLGGLVLHRNVFMKDVKIDYRIRRFLAERPGITAPTCYFGALTVGEDDGYVRPIEIAFAFDDGTEFTTLINPTRDIGDSAVTHGITATQLQIAPTLAEAWSVIEERIAGYGIVSVEADATVRVLDTELKRHDIIAPFENFHHIDSSELSHRERRMIHSGSALDRARAVQAVYQRTAQTAPVHPYEPNARGPGFFVSRNPDLCDDMTSASTLVTYLACGYDTSVLSPEPDSLTAVSQMLTTKLTGVRLAQSSEALLADFNDHGGSAEYLSATSTPEISTILAPGARVCFTGTAVHDNAVWERSALEDRAESLGLVPVKNVTKTRCDALIAADVTTMSNKAKNAAKWSKPIFSISQFLTWCS